MWTLIGLVLLIASSRLLVWGAVEIAVAFGVSDLIIGLTVVAVGTSLPELASSISALRRKEHDMVIVETGNMYVTSMQSFKDKLCRVDPRRCCGLETDRYESHEIDTSEDLKLARAFAKIDFIQDRYSPW